MSTLFPEGLRHLGDLPYTLFDAIRYALIFLGWEELPEDERPPRRIWHDGEALDEHFKAVKKAREARMRGDGKGGSREIEDPVDNSAARSMIVG